MSMKMVNVRCRLQLSNYSYTRK